MKTMLLTGMILFSTASFAGGSGGGGVNSSLAETSPVQVVFDTGDRYVWLNSLADYDGPGTLTDCRVATTYAGSSGASSGPSRGTPRTIYICRVQQ